MYVCDACACNYTCTKHNRIPLSAHMTYTSHMCGIAGQHFNMKGKKFLDAYIVKQTSTTPNSKEEDSPQSYFGSFFGSKRSSAGGAGGATGALSPQSPAGR